MLSPLVPCFWFFLEPTAANWILSMPVFYPCFSVSLKCYFSDPVSLHLTLPWWRIAQVWKMTVSPQVLEVRSGFWFLLSYKEQSSKAKKWSLGPSQTFFRWASGKNFPACCAPLFYPVEAGKCYQTKRKRSVGIQYHYFLILLNYSTRGLWESGMWHFQCSCYAAGIRGSKQLFSNFHF